MKIRRIISLLCSVAIICSLIAPVYGHDNTKNSSKDPFKTYQWYLKQIKTDYLSKLKNGTPVVAVIDTGVDYTHEDLKNNMWINPFKDGELAGKYGYDFGEDDEDPMDTFGHGTHCAGIIAAENNNVGIRGITKAQIMALKISKNGSPLIIDEAALKAFEYVYKAQTLGVNVVAVNCSWAGSAIKSDEIKKVIKQIEQKGANVIFAAGNQGVDWEKIPTIQRGTPYNLKTKDMIIVGASDEKKGVAAFSDEGRTVVDIFAPGVNILSTVYQDSFLPYIYSKEKRKELVSYYNTKGILKEIKTAKEIGIETDYKTTILLNKSRGFKKNLYSKEGCCIKYHVENAESERLISSLATEEQKVLKDGRENAGYIYLDVTNREIDENMNYAISCLYGKKLDNGKIMWQKYQVTSNKENSKFVSIGEKRYLALIGVLGGGFDGETYYLDNLAVSIANPDTSNFGKYDLMSGTSMAAPVVTGAVAYLASQYPKLTPAQRKTIILDSADMNKIFENKCLAGGIIDFSQLKTNVKLMNLTTS